MTISFQDYCEDFLDTDVALMTDDEIESAKSSYSDLLLFSRSEDTTATRKNKKDLEKAKESRKLAKFYGGKALTGSSAQKKWAESIRQEVLESSALSDDQKIRLVELGGFVDSAKFWINNKDKEALAFNPASIIAKCNKIYQLYDKHYDTLARTCSVNEKELARKEIYEILSDDLSVNVPFDFPNCDFYDDLGNLKSDMKFQC